MSREQEARRAEAEEVRPVGAIAGRGRGSLIASRYPALAQALGDHGGGAGGEPTIHDAATAAVEHKGGGAAVDAGVAARVEAHLGADFSGVRVHSDPLTQQATAAMGARAFAYGGDVFLGAGESGGDVGLMAHELTHVAQQGAAGQRAVQRRVQVGDADSPAEREADQVAAQVTGGQGQPASLLVDDGPVQPGQMLKSQFIEQLRAEVTAAADAELGSIYSAIGCPYIEQYFGRYAGQPASAGEALLRRYAPATRTARGAVDMIPAVVARVREGVRAWRETGEAPPDLTAMAPAAASSGAEAGPVQAQAQRAPDGGETLGSLEAELGPGQPLDGATASRMSDALDMDVSAARVHTGPVAARKAADAGALAFAVGANVVMGAGAPGAGTIEGDALLAHELAHTAQQAGAASDPVARRQPIGAESSAAEEHADAAAAGAVAQLHGGATGERRGLLQRLGGALKTGLQLQRCPLGEQTNDQLRAEAEQLRSSIDTAIAEGQWEVLRTRVYPREAEGARSRFRERRAGTLPDLAGLGAVTSLENIAGAVRSLQTDWATMTLDGRADALLAAANTALSDAAVFPLRSRDIEDMSARGYFSPSDWNINFRRETLNSDNLSNDEAAEVANTVAHESRHAEQSFLRARQLAGREPETTPADIASETGIHVEAARDAATSPMQLDDPRYAEAEAMEQAMGADGAANAEINNNVRTQIRELDRLRGITEQKRDAMNDFPTRRTIGEAISARDALIEQTHVLEEAYLAYRAIPYEADAHEVGDSAAEAFSSLP